MCTEQNEYLHNNRHEAAYARVSNMLKTHTLHIHLLAHMNTRADTYWDSDHWWRDWELVIEEPEHALVHSGRKCTEMTRGHRKFTHDSSAHMEKVNTRAHQHKYTSFSFPFPSALVRLPSILAQTIFVLPASCIWFVLACIYIYIVNPVHRISSQCLQCMGKNLNKAFSPSHFFLWWTLSRLHLCFLPQQFLFHLYSPLFALFICVAVFLSNLFFHLSSQSPGLPSDSMPPDLSFSRENLSFDFKDTDMKRLSMEIEKEKWVAVLWLFRAFQKFVFLLHVYVV